METQEGGGRTNGGKPRTCPPSKVDESQEVLKTCALVSQCLNLVQHKVSDLLANGVAPPDVVIGSIFLACNELLSAEELTVGARVNFINDCGFPVHKDWPGHMLAGACLTEEGDEGVTSSPNGLVTWHMSLGLDVVFQL